MRVETQIFTRTRRFAQTISLIAGIALLLGALGLLHACSAPPDAQHKVVVPNSGFESGALAPWAPFESVQAAVVTSPTHSGKFSLSQASGKGSVYVDVSGLKPGLNYTVSAWVCASEGATATAQIAVFDPSTNSAGYSDALSLTSAWSQMKYEFRIGSGDMARIHLFRNEGTGTLFWDDVGLSRKSQ